MEKPTKPGKALENAKEVLVAKNPLLGLIVKFASSEIVKSNELTQAGQLEEMRREAEKQEIALAMAERQAKVAQEIAIAHRIETAEEVEVEEFFEYNSKGQIGLDSDGTKLGIGIGGSGQRVSRRICRFKGNVKQLTSDQEAAQSPDGPDQTKVENSKKQ